MRKEGSQLNRARVGKQTYLFVLGTGQLQWLQCCRAAISIGLRPKVTSSGIRPAPGKGVARPSDDVTMSLPHAG